MPPTRALSQQVFSRATNFCKARLSTGFRRVNPAYNGDNKSTASHRQSTHPESATTQCRSYATATTATVTATVKTPEKPEAHTARTTTNKRTTASSTTKKPAANKAKHAAKAKPKPKTRAKAKPKPKAKPRKRILTEKQKAANAKAAASQKHQTLRTIALLTAPKPLPSTAWQLFLQDATRGVTNANLGSTVKEAATKYQSLAPEEREQLNHTAVGNKAKNESAHKQWLLSFTPKQIKEANVARSALNRGFKSSGIKKKIQHIQDDRLVRPMMSAYLHFLTERYASRNMDGMNFRERSALLGKEWNALSASSKKTYEDVAESDKKRYLLEYKTVYGEDAPVARSTKAATAA